MIRPPSPAPASAARLWHPWLRIQRLIRVILGTRWNAEWLAMQGVRAPLRRTCVNTARTVDVPRQQCLTGSISVLLTKRGRSEWRRRGLERLAPSFRVVWSRPIRAIRGLVARVVVVRRVFFFATDFTQTLPSATARIPLDIRPATAADIEAFADDLKAGGLSIDDARRRLQAGQVPIIAVSGGRLTHVQWLLFAGPVTLSELGLTLFLRPGDAYNSYAVTLPGWRGNGIHAAVNSFIKHYERSRGYTRNLFYVWAHNVAELRFVIGKLRRRRTKTLWCVWFFRTRRPWVFGRKRQGVPRLERATTPAKGSELTRRR